MGTVVIPSSGSGDFKPKKLNIKNKKDTPFNVNKSGGSAKTAVWGDEPDLSALSSLNSEKEYVDEESNNTLDTKIAEGSKNVSSTKKINKPFIIVEDTPLSDTLQMEDKPKKLPTLDSKSVSLPSLSKEQENSSVPVNTGGVTYNITNMYGNIVNSATTDNVPIDEYVNVLRNPKKHQVEKLLGEYVRRINVLKAELLLLEEKERLNIEEV